jgi:uncharacterized BrkB/YihY/UPF0761 family membrane protein
MTKQAFWRVALRTLLVLVSLAVGATFFGLCMPMLLLSLEILPSLGVGSIIYVIGGAVIGLIAGAVWALVSLPRGGPVVTRKYMVGTVVALILMGIYQWAYLNFDALQRHH